MAIGQYLQERLESFRRGTIPSVLISSAEFQKGLSAEERTRKQRMVTRWKRYLGQWDDPLKPEDPVKGFKGWGGAKDNTKPNLAKLIVNKGVYFLFGKEITFQTDASADEETEGDRWLAKVWKKNKKKSLLLKLAQSGAVCGQAFLRMSAPHPQTGIPRIWVVDPELVTVQWSAEDYEDVQAYCLEWNGYDWGVHKRVERRQEIRRVPRESVWENPPAELFWEIQDYYRMEGNTTWESTAPVRWDWPFAPILGVQNQPLANEYWGISDLEEDILHLVERVHFTMSNISRVLRLHGHPITWGRGFNMSQLDRAVDNFMVIQAQNGELKNLEMQSDLSAALNYLERELDALFQVASVPQVALGKLDNIGALSGLALQILYGPLLELVTMKQVVYGEMLDAFNRNLLTLGNFDEDLEPSCQWAGVLPEDPKAEAEVATILEGVGVSKHTLLMELGYDADAEMEKKNKEKADDVATIGQAMLGEEQSGKKTFPNQKPEEDDEEA